MGKGSYKPLLNDNKKRVDSKKINVGVYLSKYYPREKKFSDMI